MAQSLFLGATIPDAEVLVRVSLKVFNCLPDELLPVVRTELERLVMSPATLGRGNHSTRVYAFDPEFDDAARGACGVEARGGRVCAAKLCNEW